MLFPLNKQVIVAVVILYNLIAFTQNLQNQKYKLNLTNIIENETVFNKGLNISKNSQFYYEGEIRVNFLETGNIKTFNFFFSSWDDKYKEFIVKDKFFNVLFPKVSFKNKVPYIDKEGLNKSFTLLDNSVIEKVILSSMIVWLDNN